MQNAQSIYLDAVKALLRQSEIAKAIDILLKWDKSAYIGIENELLLQSGRLSRVQEASRTGMLAFDEQERKLAEISRALLSLVENIPGKIALNAQVSSLGSFQFAVPDNARLEKIFGQNGLQRISWLEDALKAAKSVCRVVREDGELGTGFITKEGYLFTNNHVLPDAASAKTARIEFNYETDKNGRVKNRTIYRLDSSDFRTSPPNELDFTRVKIIDQTDKPLRQWGYVEFERDAPPVTGEAVTIIQHPKGEDKQIALDANDVVSVWNQYLFYTTDTEPGSSGSPVFNSNWKVVAIHHAGRTDQEGGLIINDKGEKRGANRGILFERIFAFLDKAGNGSAPTSTAIAGRESFVPDSTAAPASTTSSATKPAPPPQPTGSPLRFVLIYDIADDKAREQLDKQLFLLVKTKKIALFNPHKSDFGGDIETQTKQEIETADYILCLFSSNLFSDTTPWLTLLLEAVENGKKVIPIRISDMSMEGTGLEKLRSLPSGNRLVSNFPNADAAYADIAAELRKLVPK
jgi:V8-like Glu-specific endopeptidase